VLVEGLCFGQGDDIDTGSGLSKPRWTAVASNLELDIWEEQITVAEVKILLVQGDITMKHLRHVEMMRSIVQELLPTSLRYVSFSHFYFTANHVQESTRLRRISHATTTH
jgi:hypothetical protein